MISDLSLESIEEVYDDSIGPIRSQHDFGLVCSLCSIIQPIMSVWNVLTFGWMKSLLHLGNIRALEVTDLMELPLCDRSHCVYHQFAVKWKKELKSKSQPSLVSTMISAYGFPFACAGLLKLVNDCCIFVGPLILNRLIHLLSTPTESSRLGYIYVFALFASNVLMSLCLRQYFWWCYRVGLRLRTAVITSVYSKSLSISAASLSKTTSGEITNLMAVDSTRLQVSYH